MKQPIQLEMKLNIMPSDDGGRVLVPGCEPTSTLTSTRMEAEIQRLGLCKSSYATVNDILEAIPGSRIEIFDNAGVTSAKRVLVLPAYDISCPCVPITDYYAIIRSLGVEMTDEEVAELIGCDAFEMNCSQTNTFGGAQNPDFRGQV